MSTNPAIMVARVARPFQSEASCKAMIWQPPLGGSFHKEEAMRKIRYTVGALAGTLLLSPAAFAQAAPAAAGGTNWVAISAAFGMALRRSAARSRSPAWRLPHAKAWRAIQAHRERFARR